MIIIFLEKHLDISICYTDAVGGSSMDYVYAMLGIKYSFTIELRSNSSIVNFLLPPDQIKPQGDEVLAGILTTAENLKA